MTVRIPLAALYFVLLVWLAWTSGEADPDWSVVVIILVWIAWVGGSVVVGRVIGPPALALPLLAIALAAVVGEIRGVFDDDMRLANWAIQIAGSLICIGFGVWLGRQRAEDEPARARRAR
jgi:hypothetical protein